MKTVFCAPFAESRLHKRQSSVKNISLKKLSLMRHELNEVRPIYLNIAYGHLMQYMGKNQEETPISAVDGMLVAIKVVNKIIKSKPVDYLYLTMVDGEETYIIQVPLHSSAGPNIIRSLKSGLDSTGSLIGKNVKIQPYKKDRGDIKYTNAIVYLNGEKLSWAEIPQDVDTREAVAAMVIEIQKHLGCVGEAPASSVSVPEEGGENPFNEFVR